ncbi:MAG: hypothetical protein DWQ18_09220 [Crenarchaeota archaeon]|nr:MAG: hypothetical protein DWQ17_00565 [Thermoproteota archaeon]RDJ33308.1 MAG: hypothetical protein DWQ18_09220 [Thermoproteota archaeon]RDJ36189.1 MAG: hypothetical protein DWQ19_06100 [Thermoproteota archaeon]RDJ38820.1 MAG: hypothetical protein DWQ13_00565 [Thermoproteota archaeon]
MKIISQNLANYGFPMPEDVIFRINLAWCNSLSELEEILKKHKTTPIFLDLPVGRLKPPNNKYSMEDLIPIIRSFEQIKYFAISNVESKSNLEEYVQLLPKGVTIIPKIESPTAVDNIKEITDFLNYSKRIIMLDHDDLFSAILRRKEPESKFKEYVKTLIDFCNENNIILLRTVGVIFSDDEKRISQYIK